MFAGPNGSGKSTIKSFVGSSLLGFYINPDEIERDIRDHGSFDFDAYQFRPDETEVAEFFRTSEFLRGVGILIEAGQIRMSGGQMNCSGLEINSYIASVLADFLRTKLIESRKSLSFETVMSSRSKVDLLARARKLGYRTYLYYVATLNPQINISRVHDRVAAGGHPVPEDKIIGRYGRSLDLLMDAIRNSDRAYIFDNSGTAIQWVAEVTDSHRVELRSTPMPLWFKRAVWDKLVDQGRAD